MSFFFFLLLSSFSSVYPQLFAALTVAPMANVWDPRVSVTPDGKDLDVIWKPATTDAMNTDNASTELVCVREDSMGNIVDSMGAVKLIATNMESAKTTKTSMENKTMSKWFIILADSGWIICNRVLVVGANVILDGLEGIAKFPRRLSAKMGSTMMEVSHCYYGEVHGRAIPGSCREFTITRII